MYDLFGLVYLLSYMSYISCVFYCELFILVLTCLDNAVLLKMFLKHISSLGFTENPQELCG